MGAPARKKKQRATYKWKPAARRNKIARDHDPQTVGEHVERLRQASGGYLSPDALVADAKSRSSPLHDCFPWNDRQAAHERRLDVARWMLRNLTVTQVYVNHEVVETEPQRVFVVVSNEDEDELFTSIDDAMSKESERKQLVKRALAELRAWRRRYGNLKELAKVCQLIDQQID
jgi:hypothetical protein